MRLWPFDLEVLLSLMPLSYVVASKDLRAVVAGESLERLRSTFAFTCIKAVPRKTTFLGESPSTALTIESSPLALWRRI